ncbi:hypothetical protein Q8A73_001406 [Channa argus]|nr:hypothetical protein Q8A73_001406 [Channa argus]
MCLMGSVFKRSLFQHGALFAFSVSDRFPKLLLCVAHSKAAAASPPPYKSLCSPPSLIQGVLTSDVSRPRCVIGLPGCLGVRYSEPDKTDTTIGQWKANADRLSANHRGA